MEALFDGDPQARSLLERIRAGTSHTAGDRARRAVLRTRIDELAADLYD
ncbi:hypothetical protein [Kitasatospora sp. MMS16-BH015]|nr:hypothetical protein [Kitasatospora sp. MMS16-BH015]